MTSAASSGRPLGLVHRLWRYPVKSMAAESLSAAEVSWHGVPGDRRWAFVRPDTRSHGFPFHTIRDDPRLGLYQVELESPERPDASGVLVHPPERDASYRVDDPELAARLGAGVQVTRLRRGLYDSMPLSLISTGTVAELCERAGVPAHPQRFRPNLLIDAGDRPFAEDDWVGRTISVGEAAFRVDRRDPRCVIVNVDPAVGEVSGNILRSLADRSVSAGVYASVVTPGRIATGDKAFVLAP